MLETTRRRIATLKMQILCALPIEAQSTYKLIKKGGPFPYPRDGIEFKNREGILPSRLSGYYKEYTVPIPNSLDRGAQRIVSGQKGEMYYTSDHYQTFMEINE
ncbi:MAG: ribonuclease domain-containing protein [Methylococcaceae bacterium]